MTIKESTLAEATEERYEIPKANKHTQILIEFVETGKITILSDRTFQYKNINELFGMELWDSVVSAKQKGYWKGLLDLNINSITVRVECILTEGKNGYILVFNSPSAKCILQHELDKKTEELNLLIYRISHDIKGPIASLDGLINLAAMDTEFVNQGHHLTLLSAEVYKLKEVVFKIGQVYNISQNIYPHFETTINAIITASVQSLQSLIKQKSIEIKYTLDKNQQLKVHAHLIRIVIFNLLENAVVNARTTNPCIHIKVQRLASNALIIQVADNGNGIAEQYHKMIFKGFFKANEYTSGAGLGLYVVNGIMNKLGGTIQMKSKLKKGTIIKLAFPQ